ncbi:wax ester/triacylglycerol synthase domain-containing protein [Streptomyces sp. NRRL S-1868]|uniref:wax ester/triacylglycerol synthase domain-containing protein n=1 Tax=Streptomyces sp. NRRL S-1868 TaxID=1463892 RepID=UPI0004C9DD3B|nr:wax ester/triacylglycerol synthase domain-containing protein [Streptomyces sp. NRRL S-1868]
MVAAGTAAFPAVDRVILDMEDDGAGHYLYIGAALEMDGPAPALDAVRAHVRERLALLPPFYGELDVPGQVRELTVPPGPDSRRRAYDALPNLTVPGTQPWGLWLVHGHRDDGYLLFHRVHHGVHDGVGLALLLRVLFALTPQAAARAAHTERPAPAAPSSARPAREAHAAQEARAAPPPERAPAQQQVQQQAQGQAPGQARARAGAQLRHAADSARLFLPGPCRPLPPAERAGRRIVSAVTVPAAQLRGAAAEWGCSVLGVHLSALSHACRSTDVTGWTRERRSRGIALPVSLTDTRSGPYRGNRYSLVRLPVPWDEPDLGRRAQLLAREVRRYQDPAVRSALARALGRLGTGATRRFSERLYARCGVQTTVLPLAGEVGFAGRPARHFTGLNCLPAHFPYQPVLSLHGGRAVCAFTVDAATPGARDLAAYWREALDELAPPPRPERPATPFPAAPSGPSAAPPPAPRSEPPAAPSSGPSAAPPSGPSAVAPEGASSAPSSGPSAGAPAAPEGAPPD